MNRWLLAVLILLSVATFASARPIDYVEHFALATDRAEALRQLVPGTDEYYYYHCLHLQHEGQFEEAERLLLTWLERYRNQSPPPRAREIRLRQILLQYPQQPDEQLSRLIRHMNLRFAHQRQRLGVRTNLPTRLDQAEISRERLTRLALGADVSLSGFEPTAFDWLMEIDHTGYRRRNLLQRLDRPDYANILDLILADLDWERSGGFGSLAIHSQLTLAQLDELLQRRPALREEARFVNAYLTKLQPNPDVNWRHDSEARMAFFQRQWQFVQTLPPAFNSLKAHTVYHLLVLHRSRGEYPRELFQTYIELPRNVHYIPRPYMTRVEQQRIPTANLSADFQQFTLLPPIGTDEPLVRSYLLHYFLQDDTWQPYQTWIQDTLLRRWFAEAKILSGQGDMERWASLLSPQELRALRERIDLDFAHTNADYFDPDDPVSLDLYIKNVEQLLVNVYEINTGNYYRQRRQELSTDVNLDGLVPNDQQTHRYTEAPLRRVRRTFQFPGIDRRGVYVVEFIGNGRSSRALIRKGRLHFLSETSPAGHAFTIIDEARQPVPGATLWMGGHLYTADDAGRVRVPFSTSPGRQPVILSTDGFSSLEHFNHQREAYRLAVGFHVDREQLIRRRSATVLIRPMLYLNDEPVSLQLLEDVRLLLTTVDLEGVSSTQDVRDFALADDQTIRHEFFVPDRLQSATFQLHARVHSVTRDQKEDLAATQTFQFNQIDRTERIVDLFLVATPQGYMLDVLGKSGEIKPDRPVNVVLKHRDFTRTVQVSLQTDENGRIHLGALQDIVQITVTPNHGVNRTWRLTQDERTWPSALHGIAGQSLRVPYFGDRDKPLREEFSLLEVRGGTFVHDRFEHLAIENGFLVISDLPAGDYNLRLKGPQVTVEIRLTDGEQVAGYAVSNTRFLQLRDRAPLHIVGIDRDDESVRIRIANRSQLSRVVVIASRYQPAFPAFSNLAMSAPGPLRVTAATAESAYVEGRDIGEEFRYILDRRYAARFPGNMLTRPSLLLNPWAIRDTQTAHRVAQAGTEHLRAAPPSASVAEGDRAITAAGATNTDFSSLDFLAGTSAIVLDAEVDDDGVFVVPVERLGDRHHIHVIAYDPRMTVYRTAVLPEGEGDYRDLRLANGLDPQQHYTEQRRISVVGADEEFTLQDLATSEFENYDTLGRVFALMITLAPDPELAKFGFIVNWPELTDEQKRERYAEFASHELNLFLSRKDPAFFEAVIRPYLANKMHRTFIDDYLLGNDLTEYTLPWRFHRLNVAERVLLGKAMEEQREGIARHVRERHHLTPPDLDNWHRLFQTALRGRSLEVSADGGEFNYNGRMEGILTLGDRAYSDSPAVRGQDLRRSGAREPGMPAPAEAPLAGIAPGRSRNQEMQEQDEVGFVAGELELRREVRQLYRRLDTTREWVETNYWRVGMEQDVAGLVNANAFWNDYAQHRDGPFVSANFAHAAGSRAEILLTLAVLDLPFEAGEHEIAQDDARLTARLASPAVIFHKEIRPADRVDDATAILVSQSFFRHGDRYRDVNGERHDKFVTDEFLIDVVYGAQVVVTNPTSARQKLDVLVQIPRGALPVLGSLYTRSLQIDLQPYHTRTLEYYFYFPSPGEYVHYPVHVARQEELVGYSEPFVFRVVEELTDVDTTSWDYISQHGSEEQVLDFLRENNIQRLNLDLIAWRVQEKDFFHTVIQLLEENHAYNQTLYSYGLKHHVVPAIRQYLMHREDIVSEAGLYIDTPLLTIDPVLRKNYQHAEYWPLVNARRHQLGRERQILNDRFHQQYHQLMRILALRPELDDEDTMTTAVYLLLQDRVEEAMETFARIDPDALHTRIQYDYLDAYMGFYKGEPQRSASIAARYAEHPVQRWRRLFAEVTSQAAQIAGEAQPVADPEDRDQRQTQLAATMPGFEFSVEDRRVTLNYQNLREVTVNYYLMDIELLFSRNPFVQAHGEQFAYIRPNATTTVQLPADARTHVFELPQEFRSSNVMVEIIGGGRTRSQAYFANNLAVQVIDTYGHVQVSHADDGRPLPRVYVKVYARIRGGQVQFYKDGYTDLRGRFDYASLSTNELDNVELFSILILSEEDGAVVREADAPKR